ncbi:hypothetical protein CANINC_002213 [Pichia inconspicua]|uniref:Uncharacterized protein n=1 Tax=Pichia inconspicua TaxID=52247 RepID=A0A4T0X243_9ASCO|nr:hypothetical protein CANINC_002213 [[Candida] inconspicua]
MSNFSHSDLHLTFRNWSSSSSEMSDSEIRRRRRRLNTSSEQDNDNQDSERPLQTDSNDLGGPTDSIRPLWINQDIATGNANESSQRSISDRRRELSMLFNVLRETSENTEWNRRQDYDTRHRRFPIGFINSHFRFTGRAIDYSFDLDHHHDDEESDDYYIDDGVFDTNIRLKNFKNRFAKSNAVYGNTFFKNHPCHEMENHIHMKVEKYGLTSLLDQLLVERSHQNKISLENALTTTRKRSYIDACFTYHNPNFSTNDADMVFTTLEKSSFLQNGNTFTSKTKLSDATVSITFTDVNYKNLSNSGYFQVGNVKLGFTGKIVDFIDNDLRCDSLTPIMIESNAFSNLLRNKFIHSSKFNKLFEKTAKKQYNKDNWKPFSMNKMGYIKFNWIHNKAYDYPHIIQSLKGTKFPNGSVFHKIKASGDNQLETFKCLSKWFDIAPLNQFNNTPAPPTPPNNLHKCSNNPENLLACKDCINMILSKYIFLKLAIDVDELFANSGTVFSDYIYKHRRRFNYHASKLAKKNTHNLRTHMERTLNRSDHTVSAINIPPLSSNSAQPVLNQRRALSDSEESTENHDSRQGTPEDMLDQQPSNVENEDGFDRENHAMFSDNEIGYLDSIIPLSGDESNDTADSFAEPWPLSNERSDEYHPILDPVFNEDSEDDLDTPYNYTINNDNRRISRLLFNINMVRQQYTPTREPVSALKMYKGNNRERLKILMMVSINRKTGELQMSAGNVDPDSWSSEQNDGELFEDVETFSKVFNLFMNDNEEAYQNNTEYTKETKKWIKRNHSEEAEQIKTLLALQVLTNPSIINAYRQREETKQTNAEKRSDNDEKIFREPNIHTMKKSSKRKKHQLNVPSLCFNDEEQEKLQLYMEESKSFEVDPQKVITMKPGLNLNDVETNGVNLSFELE